MVIFDVFKFNSDEDVFSFLFDGFGRGGRPTSFLLRSRVCVSALWHYLCVCLCVSVCVCVGVSLYRVCLPQVTNSQAVCVFV